jgi:hypothetical protein
LRRNRRPLLQPQPLQLRLLLLKGNWFLISRRHTRRIPQSRFIKLILRLVKFMSRLGRSCVEEKHSLTPLLNAEEDGVEDVDEDVVGVEDADVANQFEGAIWFPLKKQEKETLSTMTMMEWILPEKEKG